MQDLPVWVSIQNFEQRVEVVLPALADDALSGLHFDTRQYNFIDYTNVAEAKKRLYDRIIAIEGEGPGATDHDVREYNKIKCWPNVFVDDLAHHRA